MSFILIENLIFIIFFHNLKLYYNIILLIYSKNRGFLFLTATIRFEI